MKEEVFSSFLGINMVSLLKERWHTTCFLKALRSLTVSMSNKYQNFFIDDYGLDSSVFFKLET